MMAVLSCLPDGVVVHRADGVMYMNTAARAWLGFGPRDDVRDVSLLDIMHPDDRAAVAMRIEVVLRERVNVPAQECRIQFADGRMRVVDVTGVPMTFEGEPAVMAIARDLTEHKELEAKLRMADRLSSVGRLAAAVGHEINNPLTYVLGNLELMQRKLRANDADPDVLLDVLKNQLQVVREGAERVRDIVRDLRTLARDEELPCGPVDVHAALDLAASMASHELRHRARLVREYGTIPKAWGQDARLGQVFLNLLINAAQAIPEGRYHDNEVRIRTDRGEDGSIVVEVSDTGSGIPDNVLAHIFEPFYTTKPSGTGTGLGLSICHNIVSGLDGTIRAERRPSRGTLFRVTLRPAEGTSAPSLDAQEEESPSHARRRVLVIDDEPEVGAYCAGILEGEEVVVVHSGRDALGRITRGEAYDVVLCDLMMADLTGMDVFERLRVEHPGMASRVAFMTGGAFTERALRFLEEQSCPVLRKPFAPAELKAIVERMTSTA